MSRSAGDADSQRQNGAGTKFSAGKTFMERLAYRIRGGSATPETNASQVTSGHEVLSNHLALDLEETDAPSEETEAPSKEPNLVHEIESDDAQLPSQPSRNPVSSPFTYSRGTDRHERTRRLLAKYGLSVEAQDWMPANANPPTTVLRVEKQIRMRVRYTCHVCEHLFGAERNCKTCKHRRCEQCPRHPSKRSKRNEETEKGKMAANTDVVTSRKREHDDLEGIARSRSRGKCQVATEGPVPVMQLLQYCCHKCDIAFEQRGRLCSSCGHIRCSRCPRNLADYSGEGEGRLRPERVHRLPRQRIRWICDHCENTFTEGSKVCSECLHKRCQACRRIPPKRAKLDHEGNNETVQDRVREPGIS